MKAKAGFVYATRLPDGSIKIGAASSEARALAAQTYWIKPVKVIGWWRVSDRYEGERAAHLACAQWWVTRELFYVAPLDWLDISEPIVEAISRALGMPVRHSNKDGHRSRGRPVKGSKDRMLY